MRTLLILLLPALLAVGCQSMPWSNDEPPPVELLEDEPAAASDSVDDAPAPLESPGLLMSTEQRFKDIPLPAEANEDLARTYVFQGQGLELGRMVYTCRATVNELARFYLIECPAAEWTRERIIQSEEGVQLLFVKPGKRLEVTVRATPVGRAQELILHLIPDASAGR